MLVSVNRNTSNALRITVTIDLLSWSRVFDSVLSLDFQCLLLNIFSQTLILLISFSYVGYVHSLYLVSCFICFPPWSLSYCQVSLSVLGVSLSYYILSYFGNRVLCTPNVSVLLPPSCFFGLVSVVYHYRGVTHICDSIWSLILPLFFVMLYCCLDVCVLLVGFCYLQPQ